MGRFSRLCRFGEDVQQQVGFLFGIQLRWPRVDILDFQLRVVHHKGIHRVLPDDLVGEEGEIEFVNAVDHFLAGDGRFCLMESGLGETPERGNGGQRQKKAADDPTPGLV